MTRHRIDDDATLRAIARYIGDEGFPPTLRDLCALMGLTSVSLASTRVQRVARRGWITHRKGHPRAIAVTAAGRARLGHSGWLP